MISSVMTVVITFGSMVDLRPEDEIVITSHSHVIFAANFYDHWKTVVYISVH